MPEDRNVVSYLVSLLLIQHLAVLLPYDASSLKDVADGDRQASLWDLLLRCCPVCRSGGFKTLKTSLLNFL